jgi:hypothetical protein
MLTSKLPILKQKLNQLIETPPIKESVVYTAAYNAYYNVNKVETNITVDDIDLAPIVEENKIKFEQNLQNNAKKFATDFCNSLKDGGFMDTIADEITKHIQSAQINITVPALPPTITSPMGPCTGSLIISPSTGANIVIS